MKTETHQEDRVILEVAARLSRGRDAEEALEREYTELFALLPYELDPIIPPAGIWERIRAECAGTDRSAAESGDAGVVAFPGRGARAATARTVSRAPLAMAAALVVCLVGMGFLAAETRSQESAIARLESDLGATAERQVEMARVREQFEMITRVARHVYPMRPAAAPSQRSLSRLRKPVNGKVFVCGQHQQWYLNVQGLEAPPEGYEYCLWFVTDEGMVMGGAVEIEGGVAELAAPSMPVGTRGFAVTLEKEGRHDEPEGDVLLLAEEAVAM